MNSVFCSILAVVGLHTAVGAFHSFAHVTLGTVPAPADLAFILVVIFAAPVLGAVVRWRGPRRLADSLLAASFAASLVYGVASHAILPGPDNFASVPASAWGLVFIITGFGIAITEAAGVVLAWVDARRARTPLGSP